MAELNNTSSSPLYAALLSFVGTNNPTLSNKPRAYLNWILLDEQLQYVSSYPQSGALAVGSYPSNTLNTLGYTGIPIAKNGYLYIYVNNETPGWDVFFDNLSIKHYRGPISEETHYYPFGLRMSAISSQAIKANYSPNRIKFNSIEETLDLDMVQYDAFFRTMDPQIGRWNQIDPKLEKSIALSPYLAMDNNPILLADPFGDETIFYDQNGKIIRVSKDGKKDITATIINNEDRKGFDKALGDNAKVKDLMKFGISYNISAIRKFYAENARANKAKTIFGHDINTISNLKLRHRDANPKGLYAETGANLIISNGVVTIGKNKPVTSSEVSTIFYSQFTDEPGKVAEIHTHPFANKVPYQFDYPVAGSFFQTLAGDFQHYGPGPSEDDKIRARNVDKAGYSSVAVDAKQIYIYNGDNVITIKQ